MKTAAQRKQEERDRMRKSGLVPLEVWVLKEKKEEVKQFVRELNSGKQGSLSEKTVTYTVTLPRANQALTSTFESRSELAEV